VGDFGEIESCEHVFDDPILGLQERQNVLHRRAFYYARKITPLPVGYIRLDGVTINTLDLRFHVLNRGWWALKMQDRRMQD